MKINCPLHGDDDVCDQPIEVEIDPGCRGTRHDPSEGPSITDMEGSCRHVRQFNNGDLPEKDYEYLMEYLCTEVYEHAQDALEARAERFRDY